MTRCRTGSIYRVKDSKAVEAPQDSTNSLPYCELMDSYMLRAYDVRALPDGSLCVSSASRPPPEPPSGRHEID